MNWLNWVVSGLGVLIGGATLGVTIPALVIALRSERRAKERSMVEWVARERAAGQVLVTNQGVDPAFEVTIEVWDRHDVVTEEVRRVGRGDTVEVELPGRRLHGPDTVDVPVRVSPRLGDDDVRPPNIPEALRNSPFEQQATSGWELRVRLKAAQDQADAIEAKQREIEEARQVAIRVTWRSALGTWSTTNVDLA